MTNGHHPGHSPQGHPPQDQSPASGYGPEARQNESNGCAGNVVWILVGLVGLCLALCCAGGFFLYSQVDLDFQEDPEAATALTEEIADIDILPGFEPEGTLRMDMIVMSMNMAVYEHAAAEGNLVIAEFDVIGLDEDDVAEEMRDSMEQSGIDEEEMRVISSETREFEIRGESMEFEFAEMEHRETGAPYREVAGAFPGRDTLFAMIWVQVEEDYYDEDAVVKMIKSIE